MILVVEDEFLIRLEIVDLITAAGLLTYEAGSASEAVDILAAESTIGAVFTDVKMPGDMDGVELAYFVRDRYPHMIIVVSSSIPSHLLGKLPDGVPFLQKPYFDKSLETMINKIAKALK